MADDHNSGRNFGSRERDHGRQRAERPRAQEWGRGGWPSEDRGGFGREPAYGYGREGQDRPRDDDRRRDYGYGGEGSDERWGRPSGYGYGRQGDEYRPGSGGGFAGPGAGYHPPSGGRERERNDWRPDERSGQTDRRDDDRGFLDRTADEVQSWFGDDDATRRRRQDDRRSEGDAWTFAGEHRGRGPRNYTRSDDRVRDDINDRLSDDPHLDASDVEVAVAAGEVTLSGLVRDRFAKRHADDLAERVSGVRNVQNNLRVSASGQRIEASGGTVAGPITAAANRTV